ncbi:MAG: hypothetical protein HRT71_00280 [Flavobacteriales bacterium]|nr:hypothetical protein [Flavobacteriales bacterium]
MNTYNDNLHSSVVKSLHAQELAKKGTSSKENAAMFSLYYAEAAKDKATDKYENAKRVLDERASVKLQAVENSNLCSSVKQATIQEQGDVKLVTTNAAVSAANIEVAANSIVKLASDIGSIFAILNAADFNSDIYMLCENASTKINETAYAAEIVSENAMLASSLTAKVTADVVSKKATATEVSIAQLLKVAEAEYTSASALADSDNADLAISSNEAKVREATYKQSKVYSNSANDAYNVSSKELNINLKTYVKLDNSKFNVNFDFIKMPFTTTSVAGVPLYPVQGYYVMLVEQKSASSFSITDAENVDAANKLNTIFPILPHSATDDDKSTTGTTPSDSSATDDDKSTTGTTPSDSSATNDDKSATPTIQPDSSAKSDDKPATTTTTTSGSVTINFDVALDVNGNSLKLGQNYCAFVMAVYSLDYKKAINNFEDFLSAPSATFNVTTPMNSPTYAAGTSLCVNANALEFNVATGVASNVEYRCMFLPQTHDEVQALANKQSNKANLKQQTSQASEHQSDIQELTEKIATFKQTNQADLKNLLPNTKDQQAIVTNAEQKYTPKQISAAQEKLTVLQSLGDQLNEMETQLTNLQQAHNDVQNKISQNPASTEKTGTAVDLDNSQSSGGTGLIESLDFHFNKTLAEHVPMGSYYNPESKTADANSVKCTYTIEEHVTTDNFGNVLIPKNYYVPVVLTVCSDLELSPEQYSSALSDITTTPMFQYLPKD